MTAWSQFEPVLRERMNMHLNHQPEMLFERDGGPVGMKADVILARLIGFDDQVVNDTLRLKRVEPEWLMPILERVALATELPPASYSPMRTARYVLQSGYASMNLDGIYAPPDVTPGPPDFLVSVLFVRYRRRL